MPVPKAQQPESISLTDTLFISKRKTIKDLCEKIARAYNHVFKEVDISKVKNRLWKLDPEFDIRTAWKILHGKSLLISATLLNEKDTIEVQY